MPGTLRKLPAARLAGLWHLIGRPATEGAPLLLQVPCLPFLDHAGGAPKLEHGGPPRCMLALLLPVGVSCLQMYVVFLHVHIATGRAYTVLSPLSGEI